MLARIRLQVLASLVGVGLAWTVACGDSESNDPADPEGGSGGEAGASEGGEGGEPAGEGGGGAGGEGGGGGEGGAVDPSEITCGETTCTGIVFPTLPPIEPCCPDGDDADTCGLDATPLTDLGFEFDQVCQPLDQPGTLDESCPESQGVEISEGIELTLPGCCREATSTCGYEVNRVGGLFQVGLGCVDSEPFLEGEMPAACGNGQAGAGGQAGAAGQAGAGGAAGAAGAAGQAGAGGAAGASGAPAG